MDFGATLRDTTQNVHCWSIGHVPIHYSNLWKVANSTSSVAFVPVICLHLAKYCVCVEKARAAVKQASNLQNQHRWHCSYPVVNPNLGNIVMSDKKPLLTSYHQTKVVRKGFKRHHDNPTDSSRSHCPIDFDTDVLETEINDYDLRKLTE
uniref:Protein Wnt n=1 Tax=Mesocestoides corti TaxID=53468 RepID=A0A5K3FVK2_MESCO